MANYHMHCWICLFANCIIYIIIIKCLVLIFHCILNISCNYNYNYKINVHYFYGSMRYYLKFQHNLLSDNGYTKVEDLNNTTLDRISTRLMINVFNRWCLEWISVVLYLINCFVKVMLIPFKVMFFTCFSCYCFLVVI